MNNDAKVYINTIMIRGKERTDPSFLARTYSVEGLSEDSLISVDKIDSCDPKSVYCNRIAIYHGQGAFAPILNTRVCVEIASGRAEYGRSVRRGARINKDYAQCFPDRTGKITVFQVKLVDLEMNVAHEDLSNVLDDLVVLERSRRRGAQVTARRFEPTDAAVSSTGPAEEQKDDIKPKAKVRQSRMAKLRTIGNMLGNAPSLDDVISQIKDKTDNAASVEDDSSRLLRLALTELGSNPMSLNATSKFTALAESPISCQEAFLDKIKECDVSTVSFQVGDVDDRMVFILNDDATIKQVVRAGRGVCALYCESIKCGFLCVLSADSASHSFSRRHRRKRICIKVSVTKWHQVSKWRVLPNAKKFQQNHDCPPGLKAFMDIRELCRQ